LNEALAVATASNNGEALQRVAYAILDRLAVLSEQKPLDAVKCLNKLNTAGKYVWSLFLLREPVRKVLSNAIAAKGEAAEVARKLINELGRRNISDYRDLLRSV
jgi:hypothetical protein